MDVARQQARLLALGVVILPQGVVSSRQKIPHDRSSTVRQRA